MRSRTPRGPPPSRARLLWTPCRLPAVARRVSGRRPRARPALWTELLGIERRAEARARGEGWTDVGAGPAVGPARAGPRTGGDSSRSPTSWSATSLRRSSASRRSRNGDPPGDRWAICRDSEGSPFGLTTGLTGALTLRGQATGVCTGYDGNHAVGGERGFRPMRSCEPDRLVALLRRAGDTETAETFERFLPRTTIAGPPTSSLAAPHAGPWVCRSKASPSSRTRARAGK